jgi:BirA family biotin operon repressor/biotin-[acetyl-CoA-carboxylase] ligase
VVTREFLARHIPDVQIKWPNDMYIHGRKIAGDLTEHAVLGGRIDFTVAGIGINVNEDRFPEEIPHPASLFTETGRRYDVGTLMDEYMEMLRKRRPQLRQECAAELHDEYMAHLFRRDEEYFYLACGERIGGIIRDIDRYGRLILEHTADGSRHAYEYKQVGYCF